jgi:mannose-6-phosphate isomerase-like protein (cupin superfamily)
MRDPARTDRKLWLVAAALVVACGGGPSREPHAERAGSTGDEVATGEAQTVDAEEQRAPAPVVAASATESVQTTTSSAGTSAADYAYIEPPNLMAPPRREPAPLALIGYAIVPDRATHVLLATLELPPGQRFVPPISSCQDVLVYLADGTLEASGTGIGSVDAPATLYPGDAVRFGPEGDGLVVNASDESVRTIVAIARREDAGPARVAPEERSDRLQCTTDRAADPLVAPTRLASYETTQPIHVAASSLDIRILLDADAAGAEHAGLAVLSGTPETRVAEHVHDDAAEVLYVEDGDGTMHVGARTLDIHPGVSVYVPAGEPHSFEPTGRRPLRVLQFYAPSGPEQRFRGTAP